MAAESTAAIDTEPLPDHEDQGSNLPNEPTDKRIARLDKIWQSASVSPADPAAALREVERHLAMADNWDSALQKREDRAMLVGFGALTVVYAIAVTLYVVFTLLPWQQLKSGWLIAGLAIGLVLDFILFLTAVFTDDKWFFIVLVGVPLALIAVIGWILYDWTRSPPAAPTNSGWFSALAGVGLLAPYLPLVTGVLFLAVTVSGNIGSRKLKEDYAEANLVLHLAWALLDTADDDNWRVAKNRRSIAESLENAAYWVQFILPAKTSKDYDTETWLLEQRRNIAGNLRHLERWALTPRWDTHGKLVDRLSGDLLAAAYGSLGDVCHHEILSISRPQKLNSILRKTLRVIRALIAALIPLGIALLLIQQNVLPDAAVTPVLVVTGALPAVVLLRVLDPEVLDDVKKTQDFTGKLLGRGDDK